MKTDDIFPNRIEKAKEILDLFLREGRTERIGLIIFAGRTFVIAPGTGDIS
jgi:Ca-activated chloride channel family protein